MTGQGDKNINIKYTIIDNASRPTMKRNLKQQGMNYVTTRSLRWVFCVQANRQSECGRGLAAVFTHTWLSLILVLGATSSEGSACCQADCGWLFAWLTKYVFMDTSVKLMMSDLVCLWLWLFVTTVMMRTNQKEGGVCLLQTWGFTWRTS